MASLTESKAHFEQRAKEIGLTDGMLLCLQTADVRTMGTMAYAHGQPGQATTDRDFQDWATNMAGRAPTIGELACLRRLHFECQTLVLASLREQVTNPEQAMNRKIPEAERDARMATLRASLPGLTIEGPLEPSHVLLQLCSSQREQNQLAYIAPEKCVSRMHEVTTSKTPNKQLALEAERLVIKEASSVPDEAAHSALQVLEALKRRGLGYVFADSVTWRAYDRYLHTLFAHLHRDPPKGFARCSVSQLVAADKMVFQVMIEKGVKPKRSTGGDCAMDTELLEALHSYQVSFGLMPLPAKAEKEKEKEKKKTEVPKNAFDKNAKGKGKGKGKAGVRQRFFKIPQAIYQKGGVAETPAGEAICFSYNLSHCANGPDGGSCAKGKHVCCKCFGAHGIKDHGS